MNEQTKTRPLIQFFPDISFVYNKFGSFQVSSFFFKAEDGIRDKLVTGVQTCALPISGDEERKFVQRLNFRSSSPVQRNATSPPRPTLRSTQSGCASFEVPPNSASSERWWMPDRKSVV